VLLEAQTEDDVAVLPMHDEALERLGFSTAGRARRLRFGTHVDGPGVAVTAEGNLVDSMGRRGTDLDAFRLWGAHNRGNAAAAATAALAFGCTWAEVRAGAAATKPLDHRLEPVCEIGGVLYVDDSIATTPQSAIAALEAVPRPCVILVGGKDKGSDATLLVKAMAAGARGVVGIGTTGPALVDAVRRASVPAMAEAAPISWAPCAGRQ
jgi:UDP-N-acetylmuramoylalanine--D-glutamate ligase